MFTIKTEPQSVVSKLILSEATFGFFGVAVFIVLLFLGFTEGEGQGAAKAKQSKPSASGLVARNVKTIG
ncbi:MAG: hypothetical protein ACKVZH_15930 [Blastocatellia bacterium]